MSDHIAALEAALHTEAMNLPLEVLFGVLAEVKRLREELAAAEARADMHADLGRRTAEALGLTDEEGRAHMPEVAKALRASKGELLEALRQAEEWMREKGYCCALRGIACRCSADCAVVAVHKAVSAAIAKAEGGSNG